MNLSRGRKIALLIGGLVLAFPLVWHLWVRFQVSFYRSRLVSQGELFEIRDLVPRPPITPNGGPGLLNAESQLLSCPYDYWIERMQRVSPGRARVASKVSVIPGERWQRSADSNLWPFLGMHVRSNDTALASVRQALDTPALFFDANLLNPSALTLSHLISLGDVAQELTFATLWSLHNGDAEEAWKNLRAASRLALLNQGEPFLVSQWHRHSIGTRAFAITWEAFYSADWNDSQWRELQKIWETISYFEGTHVACLVERAMVRPNLDIDRADYGSAASVWALNTGGFDEFYEKASKLTLEPKEGFQELWVRYPQYWFWKWWHSYQEERKILEAWQYAIESLRRVSKNRALVPEIRSFQSRYAKLLETPEAGPGRIDALSTYVKLISSGMEHLAVVETEREIMVAALALKRFEMRFGSFPESLKELIPELLATVPQDWMDGKPLRYRRQPDGTFLLYSVGINGKDDGGSDNSGNHSKGGGVSDGPDKVWPLPDKR